MNNDKTGDRRLFRWAAVLMLLVLATMPFLKVMPAMAQSVTLSIFSGPPGTGVSVSGSGFTNGDTYQITFAPGTIYEDAVAPTTTISGTSFSFPFTVPTVPYGQYTVRVNTNRGNFTPVFQVIPTFSLSTMSGFVGDTVTVSGYGFRPSTSVNVLFNSSTLVTTQSDIYGDLDQIDFQVPTIQRGSYNMYVSDGIASSGIITFTVNPHLTINLQQGSVGSQITLSGTGFAASSGIVIYWDSDIISSDQITTNSNGSFSANIVVPAVSRGAHTITARDSGLGADSSSFFVNPNILISPTSGAPGVTVSVTGKGFRPSTIIQITFSGSTIITQPTSITTDIDGSFTGSFTVPSNVAGGYAVVASDGVYSSTITFNVLSTLILTPTTGHVGSELVVNGTGFTPGGRVTLSYDNQLIITVTADSAGSLSVSFNAPASTAGLHDVTARDLTNLGVTATATFTMESTPPPVPNLLAPPLDAQTSTQPNFVWSAVTDPSGVTYELQAARDNGFSQLVLSKQGVTEPAYQVAPSESLQLTKKSNPYYWRVRAVDRAGNASNWAGPGSFYTQDSTPPPQPLPFFPQNDTQADVKPTFSWSTVTDPSGVTYDLQVARDTSFNLLVLAKQGLTQPQYQLAQSEQLQLTKKSTPYYWRIRAVDGAGNASDWSSPISFYTQDSTPPPVPVPLSPENGSRKGGSVLFDWSDVSDPSGVTYTLQVAQDSDFTRLVIYKQGLTTSEYQLTKTEELSASTGNPPNPYYWRVMAIDGSQNSSDWSIVNAFYVGGLLQLRGWTLYAILIIGGILLIIAGTFIGMRIRPSSGGEVKP